MITLTDVDLNANSSHYPCEEEILRLGRMLSFEIVEVNPVIDEHNLAVELALSVFGKEDFVGIWIKGGSMKLYLRFVLFVAVLIAETSGWHLVWRAQRRARISLLSAASVLNAIDKNKYEVVPIGITKEGRWLTAEHAEKLLQGKPIHEPRHLRAGDPETTPGAAVLTQGESVVVPPEAVHSSRAVRQNADGGRNRHGL